MVVDKIVMPDSIELSFPTHSVRLTPSGHSNPPSHASHTAAPGFVAGSVAQFAVPFTLSHVGYCPAPHGRHAAEPSGVRELGHVTLIFAPEHAKPVGQGAMASALLRCFPGGMLKHLSVDVVSVYLGPPTTLATVTAVAAMLFTTAGALLAHSMTLKWT